MQIIFDPLSDVHIVHFHKFIIYSKFKLHIWELNEIRLVLAVSTTNSTDVVFHFSQRLFTENFSIAGVGK